MENERILKKLFDFIVINLISNPSHSNELFLLMTDIFSQQNHTDVKLQEGAMFAIKNLIEKSDLNTPQRLSRLREMGIVEELETYLNSSVRESSRSSEE